MSVHRRLVAKGKGSVDWINEWTEVKYLGGRRFAARIYSKPRVFNYNGEWLKHKLIKEADKTILISANAGVIVNSDGNVALIDPKHRKIRVLREEFAILMWDGSSWRPVLATIKGNLVKIESFEESDKVYAKVTYANNTGELIIEYMLIDGHMLKHNIKFTAKLAGKYRLMQGWLIPVKRVRMVKERLEEHEITGRKELPPKIAIRFIHEGIMITENLARLFEEDPETGELKSKIVKKIILDLDEDRGKVAILYGDWTLSAGKAFELDPDTTTISPPTDDSYVYEANPDGNYGSDIEVEIYDRGYPYIRRTFIRFDLSGIPSGVTIILAKVRLYYHEWYNNDPVGKQVDIHRVLESWDESTITWDNQPSYASTPTSSTNMPSSYGWVEWDVTDDVQDMVDGTVSNYGWCIKYHSEDVTPYSISIFYSKEYDGYDPELYVEYTAGVAYEITLSDAVGASDSVAKKPAVIGLESAGLLDSCFKFDVKSLIDSFSLYDVVSLLRSAFRMFSDLLGLADYLYKSATSFRLEATGLIDSYYTVKAQYRRFSETLGILDTRFMSQSKLIAEPLALLDSASKAKLHIISDATGLSDRVSSYIFGKMVLADGIGLYDAFTKTFTAYRTYSEPLGVYDALTIVKAQFRYFTELISLADVVAKSTYIMRGELMGLSDVIEKVFTAYREYADSVGLFDIVSKQPSRTLADHTGLYDMASKSASRRVEDSAALSDLVERHPATLVADSISLYDAYIREWTAHKEVTDTVGLFDILTPVKALFEVFSEPMALADAFTRKWDIKREYSEDVELCDEVTRRWGKWILLTESIAAYDEEYLLRLRKAVARILSPKRILPAFREQSPDRVQGPGSE